MKNWLILLFLIPACLSAQKIALMKGMIISRSVTISAQYYKLDADSGIDHPLIIIEGKDLVIDFNHAAIQSNKDITRPDEFVGLAIMIKKGSSNITIKNLSVHGYKIAVMADSVNKLTIDNCNFSFNYRQQLHSNWKREDISDWMSYHHNENNEWLRYGVGIYLNHCNNAVIKNNDISNGQCGLMMNRCDSASVFNNNFSFNSGLGIGMYRSSNNNIYNNRLDFNVRGFSFGKYYRGQDSAGILVFEQSNNNVFAYNSVTHSGDGFFLWAGQHTMDTGEGGCNDNLLYNNDFSFAPTNGVELTFSRNAVFKNTIIGCDNGIWGGYSYQTKFIENDISGNKNGIAIEHGQDIEMKANNFTNNKTSIKLWSREKQPADWGYAQKRNTESKNYIISGNNFQHEQTVYDIMGTTAIILSSNKKANIDRVYKLGERISMLDSSKEDKAGDSIVLKKMSPLAFAADKKIPANTFKRGRSNIRVTDWGPYNFSYPLLFLDSVQNSKYYFTVLHPTGEWKMVNTKGFNIISTQKDQIIATADSSVQQPSIHLEYNGNTFTDMFGKAHAANTPYNFSYTEFDPQNNWQVNFYQWTSGNPPANADSFITTLTQPVYSETVKKIDYTWWGAIGKQLPKDSFATVATTTMDLPENDYEISITADDMVKLFIDDQPVIDAWDKKYTLLDENTNHSIKTHLKGKHSFKLLHAEIDGLADLVFYINLISNKTQ